MLSINSFLVPASSLNAPRSTVVCVKLLCAIIPLFSTSLFLVRWPRCRTGCIAIHLPNSYETSPDAVQTLTFYSKHLGKTLRFGPKHSPNVASRRAVTREWSSEHDNPSPLCCNCAVVTLGLPPYRAYVETYEFYRIYRDFPYFSTSLFWRHNTYILTVTLGPNT